MNIKKISRSTELMDMAMPNPAAEISANKTRLIVKQ